MIKKILVLQVLFFFLTTSVAGKWCKSTESGITKDIKLIRNRVEGFQKSKLFLPSDPSISINYYAFENDTDGHYIA